MASNLPIVTSFLPESLSNTGEGCVVCSVESFGEAMRKVMKKRGSYTYDLSRFSIEKHVDYILALV